MKIPVLIHLTRPTQLLPIIVAFALALFHAVAWAAPYHGKTFTYGQPDGELFTVRLWGDEFFVYEETEDGYLITRDEKTGEYCYARVIKNGTEIVSTGVRVGQAKPRGLKPGQRLAPGVAMKKSQPRREALGVDDKGRLKAELRKEFLKNGLENKRALQRKLGKQPDAPDEDGANEDGAHYAPGDPNSLATGDEAIYAPPSNPSLGARRGLVLLAAFPDRPEDVIKTPQDIDRFFNDPNYTDDGNATSIYGYFHKQSGGKLRYNNVVTAYFTAKNEHDYYTNPDRSGTVRELLIEGLEAIDAAGFDFTQCDADGNTILDGINIFYAGKNDYNGIPNQPSPPGG